LEGYGWSTELRLRCGWLVAEWDSHEAILEHPADLLDDLGAVDRRCSALLGVGEICGRTWEIGRSGRSGDDEIWDS